MEKVKIKFNITNIMLKNVKISGLVIESKERPPA